MFKIKYIVSKNSFKCIFTLLKNLRVHLFNNCLNIYIYTKIRHRTSIIVVLISNTDIKKFINNRQCIANVRLYVIINN